MLKQLKLEREAAGAQAKFGSVHFHDGRTADMRSNHRQNFLNLLPVNDEFFISNHEINCACLSIIKVGERSRITTKGTKKSNTCNHRGHKGTRRKFENQKQEPRKEHGGKIRGHEERWGRARRMERDKNLRKKQYSQR